MKDSDYSSLYLKYLEKSRVELYLRSQNKYLITENELLHKTKSQLLFKLKRKLRNVNSIKKEKYHKNFLNSILNSTTLILPVYGKYDLFEKIVLDIELTQKNIPDLKIIIVDDKYDLNSYEIISKTAEQLKNLVIVKNEQNIGYLRSVNKAFNLVNTDFVVLLNTDVRLPKGWLPRLLNPFIERDVGLATCLATESGSNLTIKVINESNWREIDRLLEILNDFEYPDACTAIGYCMAVRRLAVGTNYLFDEAFAPSYGEDSDLHYRLTSNNWRSVVVKNLLVKHEGGASHEDVENIGEVRESHMKLFLDRWSEKFLKDEAKFKQLNQIQSLQSKVYEQFTPSTKFDFLFLAPGNNPEIGGLKTLQALATKLTDRNFSVCFAVKELDPVYLNKDFNVVNIDYLDNLQNVRCVIAASVDFANELIKLKNNLNFKHINLIQGPDYLMQSNFYNEETFSSYYEKSDLNLVVSPFLKNNFENYGIQNLEIYPLGPDRNVFYDDFSTRSKTILVNCSPAELKGSKFSFSVLPILKKNKWNIFGIGELSDVNLLNLFDEFYGRVNQYELSKIMRKSKIFLDLSVIEGLGLTPVEASLCGCISVISDRGGLQSFYKNTSDFKPYIQVNSPISLENVLKSIEIADNLDSEQFRKLSNESLEIFNGAKNLESIANRIIATGISN